MQLVEEDHAQSVALLRDPVEAEVLYHIDFASSFMLVARVLYSTGDTS